MERQRSLYAAAIGLLALTGTSTAASAQRAPIAIQSCTVLQAERVHRFWYPFGPTIPVGAPYADGIRIVYINVAPIAANRVAFLVNYRGDVQRIVDAGLFSPNVKIDHTFGNFSGDAYLGPQPNTCTARAVRFVDGTSWVRAGATR
ncbi:MAG: hypothetical protein JWN27_2392 [Candidatus Eremiobacteraeota bacterium]|nr:hypothetical protein [Candidatus Eremiobacteraeota bacterium]